MARVSFLISVRSVVQLYPGPFNNDNDLARQAHQVWRAFSWPVPLPIRCRIDMVEVIRPETGCYVILRIGVLLQPLKIDSTGNDGFQCAMKPELQVVSITR